MRHYLTDCMSSFMRICTLMLAPDCERSAWGRCSMKYFSWCTTPRPHPTHPLSMGPNNWPTTRWAFVLSITIIKLVFVPSQHVWTEAPLAQQQMVHGGEGGERGRESSTKARFVEQEGTYKIKFKKNSAYFWPFFRLCIHTCANAQLKMYENADTINPGTQLTFS